MPLTADEMPAVTSFHCPWCDISFITTTINDYVPLRVRDAEIDILAFCPICDAICGTTVKKLKKKEDIVEIRHDE